MTRLCNYICHFPSKHYLFKCEHTPARGEMDNRGQQATMLSPLSTKTKHVLSTEITAMPRCVTPFTPFRHIGKRLAQWLHVFV